MDATSPCDANRRMTQGQDGEILSTVDPGGVEPELTPTRRLGTFHNLSLCESQNASR